MNTYEITYPDGGVCYGCIVAESYEAAMDLVAIELREQGADGKISWTSDRVNYSRGGCFFIEKI